MTILKYPHSDQCPCCGKVGKAVGAITDGIVETDGSGYVSGSGLMVGTGGLGIGIGGGTVDMRSTSASRLQKKLDKPEQEKPKETGKIMMMAVSFLFMFFMLFIMKGCTEDMFPSSSSNLSNLPNLGKIQSGNIPEILFFMLKIVLVIFIPFFAFYFMWAFRKDNETSADNDKKQKQLENYYPHLRYCGSCHVVYDPEGYAMGVREGVVENMAKRAGIFGGRPVCHERKVNQKLG